MASTAPIFTKLVYLLKWIRADILHRVAPISVNKCGKYEYKFSYAAQCSMTVTAPISAKVEFARQRFEKLRKELLNAFHEIWYLKLLLKFINIFLFYLNSYNINGHFTRRLSSILLCPNLERNLLNICRSEKCSELTFYREMNRTFYIQYSSLHMSYGFREN